MAQHPLVGQGLLIFEATQSHLDTPQSVGLLCTSDQPVTLTLPDNTQQSQENNIRSPRGNRTRSPSQRVTADPGLRPRGHWHRLRYVTPLNVFTFLYNA